MTWIMVAKCAVVIVVFAFMVTWALIPNDTDCEWEVERDG